MRDLHLSWRDHALLTRRFWLAWVGRGYRDPGDRGGLHRWRGLGGRRGLGDGRFPGRSLVTVLGNGLDLAAVSSDFQTMITGFLIILAVGLNARRKKASGV